MPKQLNSKCQEMVTSLLSYFERECRNGGPLLPLTAVRDRVAEALQLSLTTVNRIAAKHNRGEQPKSPPKKRLRIKPTVEIDNFDQNAFRNVIYEMYGNKEHITLKTLKDKLQERELFNGCLTSLWKILKNIGFKYQKDDPRRGLMELPHIAFKRVDFLHEYVKIKREGLYQFVFLDETWIFKDGTVGRSWQDSNPRTVKKTKIGGPRYIVLHAGSSSGFIPGAELVFSSKTKDGDYHGEMNRENFLHWFEYQLLVNLEEPATIVMDNASYHSTVINKVPTTATKKADIQNWLIENDIPFENTFFKAQLLNLVQQNKPPLVYEADILSEKYGHKVLRLPPYHCMFNPIEHIWGIVKNFYRDHVGSDGASTEHAIGVWKKALETVTPDIWSRTIEHTEKIIQDWWDREVLFDRQDVPQLIINFDSDDEDSDDFEMD